MAFTEEQIKSMNEDDIRSLTVEELNEVIETLDKMRKRTGKIGDDFKEVYGLTQAYRRELEKGTEELGEHAKKWEETAKKLDKHNSKIGGFKDVLGGINGIVTSISNSITSLADPWGRVDQQANEFGKTIGLNAKGVAQLRDETIKFANDVHIGEKYNTSIKEMIELQQNYSKTVGRNLQISDKQRETLLATSKLMRENTNEFASKLENMGVGLEKSGDIAAKMFNEASKSGISFEKYSQSVTQNLTKVQSYGFKNGVEGLTSMAKKAAEVNLNIAEAFKVAEKIQGGGIQEAIKMGAGLQVLGGPFAQMGDPMGILYQGLNDVEGLQDRIVKMFGNMGQIQNGQVNFSGANRLRMRAAAESLGVSADEMMQMASRQAVRGQVSKQMGGRFNNDAELKELILNTATLNKDNEAVVNINGQEKKLSEIDARDKQALKDMQKTQSEDIKDIAQILRGYTDVQQGFQKEVENKKVSSFSEIGKFTKMMYNKLGQSAVALEVIKDAVLVMSVANAVGGVMNSVSGGMRGFSRMAPKAGGVSGGGAVSGGAGTASVIKTTSVAGGGQTIATNYGGAYSQRTLEKLARKTGGEVVQEGGMVLDKAGNDITGKAAKVAKTSKILGKVGSGVAGGAIAGVATGIGYLADGSFTNGNQSDKTKAIGGTLGSAILGGLGTAFLGPIGGMIGAELGKFVGEGVGKLINKGRAAKKSKLVEELGGKDSDKGKALASLSDSYSRAELKKIKKALEDGKITEGELSNKLMKKIAKSGDKDIIEKYGSKGAKAKINEEIEKLNAKIEKGSFDMDTGEFNIANGNFTPIEPVAYARGGKVEGPSDINGPGVPTIMGGNEFVVNAVATAKNEPILNAINNGAEFDFSGMKSMPFEPVRMAEGGKPIDKVTPTPEPSTGKGLQMPIKISNILPSLLKNPMTPLPVKAIKAAKDFVSDKIGNFGKMEVGPIKLDVSGTIKLDAGGKQVDLDAIMNNPAFLTQLSQMIERRLADNVNGGNFKELRKNKQHSF